MNKEGEQVICNFCNKPFIVKQNAKGIYCSRKCAGSHSAEKRRTGSIDKDGYKILQINGQKFREHRYVWQKVNGDIPEGMIVHHINHNKLDNRIENLQVMTRAQHQRHHLSIENKGAFRAEDVRGTNSVNNKLKEAQVLEIRDKHKRVNSYRKLAVEYGVSPSNIAAIIKHKTWTWM